MRDSWKPACAAVATAVTVLAAAAGAAAASSQSHRAAPRPAPSADAQRRTLPAGWEIVTSGTVSNPHASQSYAQATCPGAKVVYGGGANSDSTSRKVSINSSYPVGNQAWGVYMNNASASDSSFTAYAICGRQTAKWSIDSSSQTMPAGHQHALYGACPPHTKVVGGGASTDARSVLVTLNSSWPSHGGEYGWASYMNNLDSVDHVMTAYAVCAAPKGWQIIQAAPIALPTGAQTSLAMTCPAVQVETAGGVYNDFNDTISRQITINTSTPDTPGWDVRVNNTSGSTSTVTGYVICAGTP